MKIGISIGLLLIIAGILYFLPVALFSDLSDIFTIVIILIAVSSIVFNLIIIGKLKSSRIKVVLWVFTFLIAFVAFYYGIEKVNSAAEILEPSRIYHTE